MVEEDISVSKLNVVLSEYVDSEGNVDYPALEEGGEVQRFVDKLKDYSLGELKGDKAKLAFWINAYNMLTIHGILNELRKNPNFAKKGNKSYINRVNFFYRTKYRVAGKDYSLYQIENDILRRDFAEPRIHFALNCGSASCPLLKDGLYSAENLEQELEAATTLFIRSPSGTWMDSEGGILHLSSIFKWYKEDFEKAAGTVIDFVKKYMLDEDRLFIENNLQNIKVKYEPYDWGLNTA